MISYKYSDHKILNINFYAILCFLILSFLFDFIGKIEIFYNTDLFRFNRLLKAVTFVYAIIFACIHYKFYLKYLKPIGVTIVVLTLVFCFKHQFWVQYLDEYIRYSFMFVVFPVFAIMTTNKVCFDKLKKTVYLVFKYFIIINTILILLGIIFKIYIFKTYSGGIRFGYNGLLLSQGQTPYIYMAATSLFWYYKDKLMLVLILLISVFSGIKGVFLGEFLLLFFLTLFATNFNKRSKLLLVVISIMLFTLSVLFTLMTPPFNQIIKDEGLISALFSYRIDNLIELFSTMPSNAFNWLIGATGLQKLRVELQPVDVFFFFGSIGLLVYSYILTKMYKKIALTVQSKIFFLSVICLSFLSGNLLYNPLVSSLFVLVTTCLSARFPKCP